MVLRPGISLNMCDICLKLRPARFLESVEFLSKGLKESATVDSQRFNLTEQERCFRHIRTDDIGSDRLNEKYYGRS